MSHVKAGSVTIVDIDCLEIACASIGSLKFKLNQKTHRWFGQWVGDYSGQDAAYKNGIKPEDYGKCEHAIEVEGSDYDIGVVKNPKGKGYVLAWDNYGTGGKIDWAIGVRGERLAKEYNRQVVLKQARRNGWSVQQKFNNGVEQLVLTKV